MVDKVCQICNKEFVVPPQRENTAKFCSVDCYTTGKIGKKRPPFSEEHRHKISIAMKGNRSKLGKRLTEETKRKIGETRMRRKEVLGYLNSPETRKKISNSLKGNKCALGHYVSEEIKRKISKGIELKSPRWRGGITKNINKYQREYYRLKPNKKVANQKRQSIKRGGGDLTIQTIQRIYEENIKTFGTLTCIYCFKHIRFGNDSLEHIIPLTREGTNQYMNLAITCKKCNYSKNSKLLEEWIGGHFEKNFS